MIWLAFEKAGKGVHQFKPGDKVADMTVIGAYAEYICIPAENLIHVPDMVVQLLNT